MDGSDDGLTPKQRRFVQEYVACLNATEAYKKAGYSGTGRVAENAASRLLGNVGVKTAIQSALVEQRQQLKASASDVWQEWTRLGLIDARKLFKADGALKAPHEWPDEVASAVASVEVFEEYEGRGESRRLVGHTKKLKLWDKNTALTNLGKALGILKDSHEHTGENGQPLFPRIGLVSVVANEDVDGSNPAAAPATGETAPDGGIAISLPRSPEAGVGEQTPVHLPDRGDAGGQDQL